MTQVTRELLTLQAEPNWTLLGQEGGLNNPQWDQWVSCYCSLDTKSTVVVTASTEVWMGEEGQPMSWVGYEWDAQGLVWSLSYGRPEDACCRWWEVDDLVWGYGLESPLNVCRDGVVPSREELVQRCQETGLVQWQLVALDTVVWWWGPLTARQEVELGLTTAEVEEAADRLRDLLRRPEDA